VGDERVVNESVNDYDERHCDRKGDPPARRHEVLRPS
jgi:hypothetical protein